jgi:plastocyanin
MLHKKFAAIGLALVAGVLAACAGRAFQTASGPVSFALPPIAPDVAMDVIMPKDTIGENLPTVLGTFVVKDPHGEAGGFTQSHYSQTLAFPPGTKIEIWNLSKTLKHTLDVVMVVGKTDHSFPPHPKLSMKAQGKGILGAGYASGVIDPGKHVAVTLSKPGTYIIGCAFHYDIGMRDVIRIEKDAHPGPQATPPSSKSPSPSPTHSGGGGGW